MFETIFKFLFIFFKYLFIYLLESWILYSKNFIPLSTLNSKSRLVNPRDINVFYSSLKMISVDMKSGICGNFPILFIENIKISKIILKMKFIIHIIT